MSLGEKTSESFQAGVENNNLSRTLPPWRTGMTNESTINYEGAGNPHARQNTPRLVSITTIYNITIRVI
jgi:hypothetical protein